MNGRTCQGHAIYRHGGVRSGERRCRCKDCGHCFQLTYRYLGNEPGIAGRITEMVMNGSGVWDTSRVLGISQNTVIRTLKTRSAVINATAFGSSD